MTILTIGSATPTTPITVPAEATSIVSPGPIGPQGAAGATGPAGASGLATPGGRLTLTSNTPVLAASATAQNTIFYTPYIHNFVPVYNGTSLFIFSFTQTSVALDTTNVVSGSLYDLFIWNNGGTPTLGYGPAWTNTTTRSAAINQSVVGIWTNSASITLRMSNLSTQIVAANQATYVGTFVATANGLTGMSFSASGSGGGLPILALYNAYNKVPTSTLNLDTANSYTYNSATWRQANNNANNAAKYVDGLGDVVAQCAYHSFTTTSSAGAPAIGIVRNWSSGAPPWFALAYGNGNTAEIHGTWLLLPALGFNSAVEIESAQGGASVTFNNLNDPSAMTMLVSI